MTHREYGIRKRVMNALAYHMRHRDPNGPQLVLRQDRLVEDAGGPDALKGIVLEICRNAFTVETRMHPLDRARWGKWALDLALETKEGQA